MATPTIPNGEEHFFATIYEGNGAGQKVGKFVPFTDSATIAKSCIFERANNDSLSKTYSGAGTSQQTATISAWVKRGKTGNDFQNIFSVGSGNFKLAFNSSTYADAIQLYYYSGSYVIRGITNRTFEDTTKWYHIVLVLDLSNDTQTDRWRLYVDGDRITSFVSSTYEKYPSNTTSTTNVGSATTYYVGVDSSSNDYDGYIAEFNYIDGQALLPENFGETDTSTGRWVPSTIRPYPATTETITVTVVDSGGNKYAVARSGYNSGAGVTQGALNLFEGGTYRFDQSDSSNAGHPLRLSTVSGGTHNSGTEYTTGVTTVGTPGSSGAYTEITVVSGAPTLYYYCSSHSGMGGTANTPQSYGVQGTRLEFGTSSAMGDDTSGNENDFGLTNIDATNQTSDSPTQNHATLQGTGGTLSEGNLKLVTGNSDYSHHNATLKPKSGKYYAEFTCNAMGRSEVGVVSTLNVPYSSNTTRLPATSDESVAGYMYYGFNGQVYYNSSNSYDVTYATYTTNDLISIALDLDNHTVEFFKTTGGSGTRVSQGTIGLPNGNYTFAMGDGATGYSGGWTANFGQRSFTHTPPTGFVALQQDNLPETAKGVSSLVWMKNRDSADNHQLYDSSRGRQKDLHSNTTGAESTTTDGLQKFLKGGQQIEDDVSINTSGESYVSWNWVANSGTTASNGNGSITSTVQANQLAGFSIVQYTGNRTSGATIGHGLSQAPEVIITKNLDASYNWIIYFKQQGANKYGYLNLTNTWVTDTTGFNNVEPSSSVFTVGSAYESNGTHSMIAYCFHSVFGYSKMGNYIGNGVADGPFIYTGFRPRFIIHKGIDIASNGRLIDTARNPFNPVTQELYTDTTGTEYDMGARGTDFLSNGFKIRQEAGYGMNNSGINYFYMAFAEHPFVGDGTSPVTAR